MVISAKRLNKRRLLLRHRREKVAAMGRDMAEIDAMDADIDLLTANKDGVKDWMADLEIVHYRYALKDDLKGRWVKGEMVGFSRLIPIGSEPGSEKYVSLGEWSEVNTDLVDKAMLEAFNAQEVVYDFTRNDLKIQRGGARA